ncbi:DUF2336 domain-containing protein [Roseospira marina]|uniref:DUF2336 domain-containing protein n=1 Tax=Roseospira marina TaxID=140057 RepID=UPI001478C51A|nr:DUF2336 domain-containing protein [Roseospira marina]MBB4314288.1 hypothetical protein [Roseospira marina]MBB5087448.1 hypothetical protein [Roseospira marina]
MLGDRVHQADLARGAVGDRGRLSTDELLDLARHRSEQSRASLATFMMELLDGRPGRLSPSERALLSDILQTLIYKVERSIRDRLVQVLAETKSCPHDLIWFLANEPIEIAYPILLRSRVLRDEDLVELVKHKAIEHRMTIAKRPGLSQSVSHIIAEVGESNVVVELLRNHDAAIAEATLAYLVERARTERSFHEPLVRRPELTPELARKLCHWVSAALRQYILITWNIPASVIDEGLDTVLKDTDLGPEDDCIEGRADTLSQAVADDRDRVRRLIMSAMDGRDIRLAVSLISSALGLRKVLVRRILFEPASESLAIVCTALGMTRHEYLDFCRVSARLRTHAFDDPGEDPTALADFFDRVDEETARAVVSHWSRQPGFLGAVRDLESWQDE